MSNDLRLPTNLLIFGLCVPLALLLGFMLATPTSSGAFLFVTATFLLLFLPVLLRWHHFLLICTWNSALLMFFLPGLPSLGITLGFVSLLFSVVTRTLSHGKQFVGTRSLSLSLLFLAAVVIITAQCTGGIGGRVFGSETWGAKRYLGTLGAIAGYFALAAQTIPRERAMLCMSLFFLSGVTTIVSDLAYAAGPGFYFLFAFFPSELASLQAHTGSTLERFSGIAWAAVAAVYFMIMRFGIQGLVELRKFWRLLAFVGLVGLSMIGGYRSAVLLIVLLLVIEFYLEGLFRTRLFPALLIAGTITMVLLVCFIDRLPISVQRSLSILPVQIDPIARSDARGTLDWRLEMWKTLLPDVPKYLFLGKGFAFSGTDLILTTEAIHRGYYPEYESALVGGNYHNGILTILIPFGIWGMIGFVWFCCAALRVLYRNFKFGDPSLARINTFLYAYFLMRIVFFVVFYGQFDLDFMLFTGTVGLSLSINGGVCEAAIPLSDFEPAETPQSLLQQPVRI